MLTKSMSNINKSEHPTHEYYRLWLQGHSLRTIGRMFNHSRSTIHYQIQRVYGKSACDIRVNGLARVIMSEYPGQTELIEASLNVPGRFYTTGKERTLSRFQAAGEAMERIPYYDPEPDEQPDGLKLTLFIWVFEEVACVLGDLLDVMYIRNDHELPEAC
jgi:hypothetical protein